MSRVLVTGSAGLVGRRLCEALAAAGHEAVPFDLCGPQPRDIRDTRALSQAMRGCVGVAHLAAISRVAWGEADPALCDDVNVAGTEAVLLAARAASPRPWLLFASSREVYGDPDALPVREDAQRRPVNAYGRSKLLGEQAVEAAAADGLRAAIVRLSNVYGTTHDHPDRAVPSLLWRAMEGLDLVLSGADVVFDFVHVDDCARGLLLVADRLAAGEAPPPIHLATGVGASLLDLARTAADVAGSASPIVVQPARRFDVSGFVGDPSRAAAVLGFRTEVALEDGLCRLRDLLAARGRAPDPAGMPPPRTVPAAAGPSGPPVAPPR